MGRMVHFNQSNWGDRVFPEVAMRSTFHGVKNIVEIKDYKSIVDIETNHFYTFVSNNYKLVQHEEVVENLEEICAAMPEFGEPTRECWLSNKGGSMRVRYTFREIDHVLGKDDIIHPTIESFASFDTNFAQRNIVGAFRLVCSNGMILGKLFAEYKKKHTTSLDLEKAKTIILKGMQHYSDAEQLWISFMERQAIESEVFLYEALPFHKEEKRAIELEIHQKGDVLEWDVDDKEKRKVDINAWEMYNILTAQVSHEVQDVNRQIRISDGIAKHFMNPK